MAPGGYSQGLHEIGDGLFAYLQPDGGWGLSNAGLVTGAGSSMLIDTLFDLRGAREMLDALAKITAEAPIGAAVNTHGNGDHCFGNQLLPAGIPIHATRAAEAEIRAAPPAVVASLEQASDSPAWQVFWARTFGRFDFADVEPRAPTELFDGRVELSVAGRALEIVVNVETLYREFDAARSAPPPPVLFVAMAEWSARHS